MQIQISSFKSMHKRSIDAFEQFIRKMLIIELHAFIIVFWITNIPLVL